MTKPTETGNQTNCGTGPSLAEKVARFQAEAVAAGFVSDGRDDKAFMDAMWGDD